MRWEPPKMDLLTSAVIESLSDGVILLNTQYRIEAYNTTACGLLGYENTELKNKHIIELLNDNPIHILSAIFTSQLIKQPYKTQALRKDKTLLPVQLSFTRISLTPTEQKEKAVILCVIKNIVAQKQAETYLTMYHEIASTLINSATVKHCIPQVMYIIGKTVPAEAGILWKIDAKTNRLVYATSWHAPHPSKELTHFCESNKTLSFALETGLPGKIWASQTPHTIGDNLSEVNLVLRPFAQEANLQGAFGFPIFFGGKVIAVLEFYTCLPCLFGESLAKILADIGNQLSLFIEREEAQNKVKTLMSDYIKAKEEAAFAHQFKSEFLANITHELSLPIRTIISYSEILQRKAQQAGLENYSPSLQKIIHAAQDLLNLIDHIVNLSLMEEIHLQPLINKRKSILPITIAKKSVLIIDADSSFHSTMKHNLEKAGFITYQAVNNQEGLNLAKKYKPDLITLDILPDTNGWGLLSAFKTDPELCHIPVILVSSLAEKQLGYSLGATDYLQKPIDTQMLTEKINQILAEKKNTVL